MGRRNGGVYAVARGRTSGLYKNWEDVRLQVEGYSGAVFKWFPNEKEAHNFIYGDTNTEPSIIQNLDNYVKIYTDGSFNENKSGFGIVILLKDGTEITVSGPVLSQFGNTNQVAELFAIYVALSMVRNVDTVIYTDSMYAVGTFTAKYNSKANKELIQLIHNLRGGRNVEFKHVYAHTGIPNNEKADKLADEGRKVENFIFTKNGVVVEGSELT